MPKIIENVRGQLLAEARRQVAQHGYADTTIRSVAGACGLGAESLFMNSGEVTISCEATRQTGTKSELSTKVTLKPATRHTVKFDLSTAGNASVVITFDDTLEEVVELEFEMNDKA